VLGNIATHVLNGPLFTLPYDPQRDFQPVSLVSNEPLVIIAKKTIPANDLAEFVAWLKANPDKATQGTSGAGALRPWAGFFSREKQARGSGPCPIVAARRRPCRTCWAVKSTS